MFGEAIGRSNWGRVLSVIVVLAVIPTDRVPIQAFTTMTVNVTIATGTNRGHCWDGNRLAWCNSKLDYFAVYSSGGDSRKGSRVSA